MGRKTTVWTRRATNNQNLTREILDLAKKVKPKNTIWISSDSNTKQRPKDYVKSWIDSNKIADIDYVGT